MDDRITTSQTTTLRSVTSIISIVNATDSDSGTYVCRVGAPPGTNFNTTDSDSALILVQGMCSWKQTVVLLLYWSVG